MQRFLMAFVSREGQTERVAHHVARFLEDRGALVRLIDVAARETEAGADDCDALIIAGSLRRGRFDPELSGFVMRHGEALHAYPSVFLPVSVSAAATEATEPGAIDEATASFLDDTGWTPTDICHVASALSSRNDTDRYSFASLFEVEDAEKRPSGETDSTNWIPLDEFIRTFLVKVRSANSNAPGIS
jgi:menaquinone-dependent protoporphyrinogen oxidase